MEATGHYWKNLFAVLAAAGHEVALLNPFVARRFQDASLERTKTDAIDAHGLARFAFEKRPGAHPSPRRGCRDVARARPPPRPAATGFRRPRPPAAPPGRSRLPRVHPLRPRPRQHARHLSAGGTYPTAQAFARTSTQAPGQAALRWPPFRRRRAGRATRRGRKDLRRPTPRTRLQAPGHAHLSGSRPLAQTPRRPSSATSRTCSTPTRSASC